MGKQVYSIVLDDDVIRAIDACALQSGTSRSNMINRILAEYVQMPTAETMINDIFSSISQFMQQSNSLAVQLMGNGSLINMKSALKYKYNPSVKYTVEIYENSSYLGSIRISMRSQNSDLIAILNHFLLTWAWVEKKYAGLSDSEYEISDGRYTRLLRFPADRNGGNYGRAIAYYVDLMDKCMKDFFTDYRSSPAAAEKNTEKTYLRYMTNDVSQL